jgi:hypothetical protein
LIHPVRCVGAGPGLGRWPWSGEVPGLQLAPPPGAGDADMAEGIVTRMNVPEPASNDHYDPLLRAAERVLAHTWGHEVRLGQGIRLTAPGRRNLLLRCPVLSGGGPASLIVKQVTTAAASFQQADLGDVQRFCRDWAGAQFVSTVQHQAPHSPRFYGGNREAGFILLEDLGAHASLVEPLLHGAEADAIQALLGYAARLGALHTDTIGQEAAFTRLWQTLTPQALAVTDDVQRFAVQIRLLQHHMERLGARVEPAFGAEVATTLIALHTPGPFWAYLHGDPCPDNVVYPGAAVRLLDFECGRFGQALCDGTYGRMLFPTCWCANRLPETVVTQMETVYRAALVPGCPAAADEHLFEDALVDACGYWVLRTLVRHLPQALYEDRPWGIATIRPRLVSRLEAFITTAEAYHRLPAMRGTAHRVLEALRRRWPATPPLALYPAFRQDAPRQRETTEPG